MIAAYFPQHIQMIFRTNQQNHHWLSLLQSHYHWLQFIELVVCIPIRFIFCIPIHFCEILWHAHGCFPNTGWWEICIKTQILGGKSQPVADLRFPVHQSIELHCCRWNLVRSPMIPIFLVISPFWLVKSPFLRVWSPSNHVLFRHPPSTSDQETTSSPNSSIQHRVSKRPSAVPRRQRWGRSWFEVMDAWVHFFWVMLPDFFFF